MENTAKPALVLPIGEKDWNNGNCAKLEFMLKLFWRLHAVGWTIGVDLKGGNISWAKELCDQINKVGGFVGWHPSLYPTLGWGSTEFTLSDTLKDWALQAKIAKKEFGLKVLNIHLGAPQYASPAPSGPDRFICRLTADELVKVIKAHVPLLKEMNKLCGRILTIENVHTYLFHDVADADEYFVYNAMQIGSWWDLLYLAQKARVSTCVDMEHLLGADNFLHRSGEFEQVPQYHDNRAPMSILQMSVCPDQEVPPSDITGYELYKGLPPNAALDTNRRDNYYGVCAPKLLHLGTVDAAIENGLCADHLEFNLSDPFQKRLLTGQLQYIEARKSFGGVIEACGQTEGGFNWTKEGRSVDPDQAKFNAFLSALEVLEEMHAKTDEPPTEAIWRNNVS